MNRSVKRRLSAWLLLLVFVPVIVATSLHVHDYGEINTTECEQCLHHLHHGGHFNAYANHSFDCPLCQFASLPFVISTAVAISVAAVILKVVYTNPAENVRIGICNTRSTRAPPVFSF